MWLKGKTIDDAVVIGIEEGGLYKLKGNTDSTSQRVLSVHVNYSIEDLLM